MSVRPARRHSPLETAKYLVDNKIRLQSEPRLAEREVDAAMTIGLLVGKAKLLTCTGRSSARRLATTDVRRLRLTT